MKFKRIYIDETISTNDWLKDLRPPFDKNEDTIVSTDYQKDGHGCDANKWESERGKNLLVSILWHPKGMPANSQFYISVSIALAIKSVLRRRIDNVSIKWPNDIYVGDRKICGMLIENQLQGSFIVASIIGFGLNVNQSKFVSDAPNPVSLIQLLGEQQDRDVLLKELEESIDHYLTQLKYPEECQRLFREYEDSLYRKGERHAYRLANGEEREGTIMGVEQDGKLRIAWAKDPNEAAEGETSCYAFKQVSFII